MCEDYMDLCKIVTVDVRGKWIVIEIHTNSITVQNLANTFIETRLISLADLDIIKHYVNRLDFFMVRPQDGWQPVEVLVEIKKRLNL